MPGLAAALKTILFTIVIDDWHLTLNQDAKHNQAYCCAVSSAVGGNFSLSIAVSRAGLDLLPPLVGVYN